MTEDHYFETRFTDADGAVPAQRYRTLQGAMTHAEGLSSEGAYGSIWYREEPESDPVEMFRYNEDGSLIDAQNDDGTNYPLGWVPDTIEPGALMFSLWLRDPDGKLAPYDFGFDWDGAHEAMWQCSRGDGPGPSFSGTITWAGDDDHNERKDSVDENLGDDLEVWYSSSSATGEVSGETRFKDAGLWNAIIRDAWVATAREIFEFLRGRKLI